MTPLLRRVAAVLTWLLGRLSILAFIGIDDRTVIHDVAYYHHGISSGGLAEYPEPSLWLLYPLHAVFPNDAGAFTLGFLALCLLLDAAFCCWLAWGNHWPALWFWLLFSIACGPMLVFRMDLIPALLVGVAALALLRGSRLAAIALGYATAVKLWPGVLAAGLVTSWRDRDTWRGLAWFLGTLAATVAVTIAFFGVERVLSPLNYQGERGLQVESVAATPFVLLAWFKPQDWEIWYAPSKSLEIQGPGTGTVTLLSSVAMFLLLAFAVGFALRRFRQGGAGPHTTLAFWLVLVMGLIVANKVFSTQYMLWLGPLIAACLVGTAGRVDGVPRPLRHLAWLAIPLAALSTFIYPVFYDELVNGDPQLIPVIALVLRNALMLLMLWHAVQWLRFEAQVAQVTR
ncbi:DUF2029 domain-containing protein [Corynebacterium sp. A21]|uniref:DUF2029 domain-containing protein n=1 Tax=Corynebacterium sp. A21 TaxID=3457318 RepID=UPI003FD2B359